MAEVIIVGDGPGGLSAALFLAKNGQNVTVYGMNETAMQFARLFNYLGIPEITGTELQKIGRGQAEKFGAKLVVKNVVSIAIKNGGSFRIKTEDGTRAESKYVILAEGKALKLATALSLPLRQEGVLVDHNCETEVSNLYAVGRAIHRRRSQAIISAGDGARAALDILSKETGKDFCDFDSVD